MSTRRVKPGTRRTQHGWASAPEFDELRGLNGSAVAFKAALLDDPRKRALLYFLQAHSLKPGGIKRIACELMEMFPDRIASPTMFKIGCRPGKRLSQKERDEIAEELIPSNAGLELLAACGERKDPEHCQSTAEDFARECRELAEGGLDEFIERLCCDPKLALTYDDRERLQYRGTAEMMLKEANRAEESRGEFDSAQLPYFHDVLGALFEYQKRYESQVRADFVETSIGKIVFEALDYALETGRSALIEGNAGIGKTTALKAWCETHLSQARFVSLKGVTYRTGLFQELARAIGIARGGGLSPSKVQMRVEQFLQRTKVMLVIDEGQYLFPPGNRVYAPPELINWLMTACYNEGVPFAISATSEFRKRRIVVERNTTWQSEQLRRRIRRFFALPLVPDKGDLMRVAQKLLPDAGRDAISYVVGYSLVSKQFFQGITDAIEDARLIARRAGREEIKFADLKEAIQEWRSPSDAALQRVLEDKPESRRGRRTAGLPPADPNVTLEPCNDRLNDRSKPVKMPARGEISLLPA